MLLVVPERSLGGFQHNGCPKDTSRKLHIYFQISTIHERGPTPGVSGVSSKCHPWSLRGFWRFLRGVLVVTDIMDATEIHQGSYRSIFRFLPSWEVLHRLCGSRASSWSLRGRWWFLRGVFVVFKIIYVSRIHHRSYISIFRYLPSRK